jgi:hypothetical protein
MLKKNFSIVLSLFVFSAVIGGCGRPTLPPLADETVKTTAPATITPPVSANVADPEKEKVDREIVSILSEEGLELTEAGINASGIFASQNSFSTKADPAVAEPPASETAKNLKSIEFYQGLRDLYGLKGKERKDKIADLRKKFPYYFAPVYRRLCYVLVPKFRYCNEDGS